MSDLENREGPVEGGRRTNKTIDQTCARGAKTMPLHDCGITSDCVSNRKHLSRGWEESVSMHACVNMKA